MRNSDIDLLIVKFLENKISSHEFQLLENQLKKKEIQQYFKEYLKLNYSINLYKPFNSLNNLQQLKKRILKIERHQRRKKARSYLLWAATFLFLFSTTLFLENFAEKLDKSHDVVAPGSTKATLVLEDGVEIHLDNNIQHINNQIVSNGNEIIYKAILSKKPNSNDSFNTLKVPRSGQFNLTLADGTKVRLNSESVLRYPVSFDPSAPREVELVFGEAYFDVSHPSNSNGSVFRVLNNNQVIEVLGTQFNIRCYRDEPFIYTTLKQGEILLKRNNTSKLLKPSQQAVLDIKSDKLTLNHVDVSAELAWLEGYFTFNKKPLSEVLQVLSRWYDVDFILNNGLVSDNLFNGKFSRHQDLDKILELIKETGKIKSYKVEQKKITIK